MIFFSGWNMPEWDNYVLKIAHPTSVIHVPETYPNKCNIWSSSLLCAAEKACCHMYGNRLFMVLRMSVSYQAHAYVGNALQCVARHDVAEAYRDGVMW